MTLIQTQTGSWPDARGRFGEFGGRHVPERLMPPVEEMGKAYTVAGGDGTFQGERSRVL